MGKKVKRIVAFVVVVVALSCLTFMCSCSSNSKQLGFQLQKPTTGEEIAVMTTNKGTIKMRFFDQEAPKTTENFKTLSKQGYYNGVTFHRVIKDFMIQGGDPTATGTGGQSIWGTSFEDEFNQNLVNITGAVAMANSGKDTNGSQFFINDAPAGAVDWNQLQNVYSYYSQNPTKFNEIYGGVLDMSKITESYKTIYDENGGNPSLDGYYNTNDKGHTVFAQVFEGLDVVDQISSVTTDSSDKPVEDVVIQDIQIIPYEE